MQTPNASSPHCLTAPRLRACGVTLMPQAFGGSFSRAPAGATLMPPAFGATGVLS